MFGERKVIETEALPPLTKAENNLSGKNTPGEIPAPIAKTVEKKFAANFTRLKKSLRKRSHSIL